MSRKFAGVSGSFWTSENVASLPPATKLLALYLLTCPHGNAAGVFRLPVAYVCEDLKLDAPTVRESLAALSRRGSASHPNPIGMGFATFCPKTQWIVIHKALKHLGEKINANYAKHILDSFSQLPLESTNRAVAGLALREYGQGLPAAAQAKLNALAEHLLATPTPAAPSHGNGIAKASRSDTDPHENIGIGIGIGNRKKERCEGVPDGTPPAPEGAEAPAKNIPAQAPTVQTWGRYASAFKQRYGHEPARNAAVNGQLAQLVARLGKEEAPEVAAWYVSIEDPFYVKQMHPVKLLLADYEKVRGYWKSGRKGEDDRLPPKPPWWATDKGIEEKAAELGMKAHGNETYAQLRERVRAKMESKRT